MTNNQMGQAGAGVSGAGASGAGASGAGTSGGQSTGLPAVVEDLRGHAQRIQKFATDLTQAPGLAKLGKPFAGIASLVSKAGDIVEGFVAQDDSSKVDGVGGFLGAAENIMGMVSDSKPKKEGEGPSKLDTIKEKVGELKSIWNEYYDFLSGQEKKISFERATGLALQVGETILGAKKMAKVKKAVAIANIIRNNAEAITKAAASVPPPFNVPLIVAAKVLGLKQLTAAKGQAHDGLDYVPKTGTYLLERGERVVDSRLNADLKGFLTHQSRAASIDNSVQSSESQTNNRSVTNAPVINMSFSGGVDENTVLSNRAAMEAMMREVFADHAMEAPFG